MLNVARRLSVALVVLVASPALADDGPITHTDQLIVVTPNPPVVISNGAASTAPGAAPAAAAPVAPIVANGAPINEPWEEVSHINGTPVKVGERGAYLLRYRKTNISTNPIGWMFGIYGLSVSHAVSSNVAIRADANIINFEGEEGFEFGAGVPIYFRRVYSGPFIEPGLITRGSKNNYCYDYNNPSGCMATTETWTGPAVMFGWHWTFDSGLNVAFAAGAMRPVQSKSADDYYDDDGVQPAGYFRIGYSF